MENSFRSSFMSIDVIKSVNSLHNFSYFLLSQLRRALACIGSLAFSREKKNGNYVFPQCKIIVTFGREIISVRIKSLYVIANCEN